MVEDAGPAYHVPVRGRLGWACVLAAAVCLAACQPGSVGLVRARAVGAASGAATTGAPGGLPGSQPQPGASSTLAPELVAHPDFPAAMWIPAAPANFSLANRPHDYGVDMIIVHDTEVSMAEAIRIFQDPARQVSANYLVSAAGHVTQMVLEKDIAWHAGNWDYNTRAIGIELEGHANSPGSYTEAEYRAGARLAASICSRWGVAMDRAHVIGHYQVPDADHPGLFGGYSHRTDPGPFWDWAYFIHAADGYAAALPSPPRLMVDPVAVNGLDSATVTWQTARSCHLPIQGYTVVGQPGNLTSYLPATATEATFRNLQPGTSYTFTVTAADADGQDSLTSNAVVPGRCNALVINPVVPSPLPYGRTLEAYTRSVGCAAPLYAFALSAPGSSAWAMAQPFSRDPVLVWNTVGHPAGTYSIRVLARDARSPGTHQDALGAYDGYADISYTVAATPCSSVAISGSPPRSVVGGAVVTITALASGCPAPQYEFWIRPAPQLGWRLVQGYGGGSAVTSVPWDTGGRPTGTVVFAVWARDASRQVGYDATATAWYQVTTTSRRGPGSTASTG